MEVFNFWIPILILSIFLFKLLFKKIFRTENLGWAYASGFAVIVFICGVIVWANKDEAQIEFTWLITMLLSFPSSLLEIIIRKPLMAILDFFNLYYSRNIAIFLGTLITGCLQYYLFGYFIQKLMKKYHIFRKVMYSALIILIAVVLFADGLWIKTNISLALESRDAKTSKLYEVVNVISEKLQSPSYLAIDNKDNLYVYDAGVSKIVKFNNKGKLITSWGRRGKENSEFGEWECMIAADDNNNIYVADGENSRVQKFNNDGKFLKSWGKEGKGNGEFMHVSGITVDKDGRVFVFDYWNHRIEIFDNDGKFIEQRFTRQFDDMAIDSQDNLYVVNNNLVEFIKSFKIEKFDKNGKLIMAIEKDFNHPNGIAIDKNGNLFVADSNNDRVKKFDSNGKYITTLGAEPTGARGATAEKGRFCNPTDVAIDSVGNVYISDKGNKRIQKFTPR